MFSTSLLFQYSKFPNIQFFVGKTRAALLRMCWDAVMIRGEIGMELRAPNNWGLTDGLLLLIVDVDHYRRIF